MSTGNRLMIVCMTLVALACIAACAFLALHGQGNAIAIFVGIGISAINSLQPSALHQGPGPAGVASPNGDGANGEGS